MRGANFLLFAAARTNPNRLIRIAGSFEYDSGHVLAARQAGGSVAIDFEGSLNTRAEFCMSTLDWFGKVVVTRYREGPYRLVHCRSLFWGGGGVQAGAETGTRILADDHKGYSGMSKSSGHGSVKHRIEEYVNGMAHTNGIKSLWAVLRRGYNGTYHQMSPKHIARYATKFAGRRNVRGLDTLVQMKMFAKGLDGTRLHYDDLGVSL